MRALGAILLIACAVRVRGDDATITAVHLRHRPHDPPWLGVPVVRLSSGVEGTVCDITPHAALLLCRAAGFRSLTRAYAIDLYRQYIG